VDWNRKEERGGREVWGGGGGKKGRWRKTSCLRERDIISDTDFFVR